jgi:nitroreductase
MEAIMDVYEAVKSRRSVRGFKDEPVERNVLERVLSAAAWSPSGSNIQPWNTYVMTGAPLAELKTSAVERVAHGDAWEKRQYEMYPAGLKAPYGERRSAFGGALQRARHCARGLGGAPAGSDRQLELFRRARRPILLHRP